MDPGPLPGTDIEILTPAELGPIRHAVFDFDGTISLLREGWERVMGPFMTQAIMGGGELTAEAESRVAEYIDESTGIQTILQMEHLVEMVRHEGRVADAEIKSAQEYKAAYNDALMVGVRERIESLQSGRLTLENAMVHGAREFVAGLSQAGVTLYLASGTDVEDVRREAEILGMAHYFTGGIWGALKTFEEYSKDKVIKAIIAEHRLRGPEVLVCGDGPVEIRNARANGCIALGVASDEVKGQGWNQSKRRRLCDAGADILVPDFNEGEKLLDLLLSCGNDAI